MSEQEKQGVDLNTVKKAREDLEGLIIHDPVTLKTLLDEYYRNLTDLERENRRLERQLRNYDDGENYWVNKRFFLGILIITAFMLVVSVIFVVITLVSKASQFDFLLYTLSVAIIVFSLLILAFRISLRKSLNI